MTFEDKLFARDDKRRARFAGACKEIFASPAGQIVLAELVRCAHPLAHADGMTPHDHGQSEVVATLWRFGSQYGGFQTTNPE